MEGYLKELFDVAKVTSLHHGGSGCISEGSSFQVGDRKMFVKINSKPGSDGMFKGEFESLKTIHETSTIRVPKPYKLGYFNGNHIIAMEHLDLSLSSKHQKQLGYDIADLHLHNITRLKQAEQQTNMVTSTFKDGVEAVNMFGFPETTCCGFHPLVNTWSKSWLEFYCRERIQNKISAIQEEHSDRDLSELWSELQLVIDKLYKNLIIYPSLIHGDLWSGNVAEVDDQPVIYDPASCYAHHEFELSISTMFGGFNRSFFDAYHSKIPKSKGFDERHDFYMIFHYLNHWHHFGTGYRSSSLSTMRNVLKKTKCME